MYAISSYESPMVSFQYLDSVGSFNGTSFLLLLLPEVSELMICKWRSHSICRNKKLTVKFSWKLMWTTLPASVTSMDVLGLQLN